MATLNETINTLRKDAAQGLRKHLSAVGVRTWKDITYRSLERFRNEVTDTLAPGSARVVMANLKTVLNRGARDGVQLISYAKILSAKGDAGWGVRLTAEDLEAFERVATRSAREEIVKAEALGEALTGARVSDLLAITEENYIHGSLVFGIGKWCSLAVIPADQKIRNIIEYIQSHQEDRPSTPTRNNILRRLAKIAGIDEMVTIKRGKLEKTAPKYEVLSSNDFRRYKQK